MYDALFFLLFSHCTARGSSYPYMYTLHLLFFLYDALLSPPQLCKENMSSFQSWRNKV